MQCLADDDRQREMFPRQGFRPPGPLKNATLQTVLSSSRLRTCSTVRLRRSSRPRILALDGGVKLLGFYSQPPRREVAGIVVLLHGWEGSAHSTYVLRTAQALFDNGFAVLRLNFRDHGGSHSLNENIFFATLLEEVFCAVRQAAQWFAHRPAGVVGFSLGGNFALRIARQCRRDPIENLTRVAAVSPVIDPGKSTDRVDRIGYIRRYFLYKWRRSLRRKQTLFPDRFRFEDLESISSVREMTDALLERYSRYGSAAQYFAEYNLCGNALEEIDLPTLLLTAADDPIIPIEDFQHLATAPSIHLSLQRFGGHNGFIDGYAMHSWYEDRLVKLFLHDLPPG
jgi:hypothetical protein